MPRPIRSPRLLPRMRLVLALVALAAAAGVCFSCFRSSSRDDVVELRFWYAWGGYEGRFLETLIEEFNQTHPHIRVKGTFFNIGDKLLAAIAGGKPPDVATVWDYMLATMGEAGCFLPLEDRLREAGITPESYLPNIWEYGMYGKHKWGVPTTLNVMGIYYNKTLAREVGLDPENPPKTLDELEHWAEALLVRSPEGAIQRIGFVPVTAVCYMWNFGGGVWDAKTHRFTLDRPENIQALEWMKRLYDKVGIDNFRRFQSGFARFDSEQNPFIIGKMAMREDGQWAVQLIQEFDPRNQLDYGVFGYPPARPGQPGQTSVIGSFWVIPKGTRHPEEAWEFLQWLIDPKQSARFCARLRNIPPLHEGIKRPEFQQILDNENFKVFVDLLLNGHARPRPALPIGQELEDKLSFQFDVAMSGRVAPAEFLQTLQRDMTRKLDLARRLLGIDEAEAREASSPGGSHP